MFRRLIKVIQTGIVTDTQPEFDEVLENLGHKVKKIVNKRFHGSFAIRQVDAGSCNGCELEIHALNNPFYAVERFGIHFVPSPRHADALLVTGPISKNMHAALLRTYAATPAPKWVIATGDCACDGGEFGENYATVGALEKVLPVDLKIPGCPPTPTRLLSGIYQLISD